jgi:hypothetical protein
MREKHDDTHLDALRERLYARGEAPKPTLRDPLVDDIREVPKDWNRPAHAQPPRTPPPPEPPAAAMGTKKPRYSYRMKILLTAIVFFVAAVLLSSLFIAFGGNTISGDNIAVSVTGPFTVGGGEEMPLSVAITNQNSVAIQSATLIVEYPDGTQSATVEGKQLFVDRLPLDAIGSGETVNVPLRARVFGEENEELSIKVSVEYRVANSNATFYKEADPLRFKIGSSPVSLEIDSVDSLASGQEADITLTVHSNASTPLTDLLVQAVYPSGFDFTESDPSPVSGRNTWSIAKLDPEGSATIKLKGVITGGNEEARAIHFSVGVPSERDRLSLASVYSTVTKEFTVEQPFLDVGITVDGSSQLSAEPGESSNVEVTLQNTLSDSIYDAEVTVSLAGNALSDVAVFAPNGYYDSNSHTVTFDASSDNGLGEIGPSQQKSLRFTVTPNTDSLRTPQINLDVSVRARRVRESAVSEALVGSAHASIKVASNVTLSSDVSKESGPSSPTVGKTSTYRVALRATAGSNDTANATVSATLPSYVTWVGETGGDGNLTYSASTRTVEWKIGNLDANDTADGTFQVSILPSTSQIGTTPTLVGTQNLRAEDRFTGTVIRTSANALTTETDGSHSGEVEAD